MRGGQELGRLWYEDGRMFRKRNTFTDFERDCGQSRVWGGVHFQPSIDAAQQMIAGNVVFEIERVEQRRLAGSLASHHGPPHPIELLVAQI